MSWRSTRRTLRWTFAGAAIALVALQMSVSAQPERDPIPNQAANPMDVLRVELEAQVEGREVTFTWVFDDVDETEVVCTFDPQGDDLIDYSVPDCDQNRALEHRYEEPGVYFAQLLARSRDGRSGRAVIRVDVR